MKAPILSAYTGLQERPESCDMERGYTAVLLYQKSGPPSRATTVLFFVGNGGMDNGNYYRDPFSPSLLSTRQKSFTNLLASALKLRFGPHWAAIMAA